MFVKIGLSYLLVKYLHANEYEIALIILLNIVDFFLTLFKNHIDEVDSKILSRIFTIVNKK